MALTQREAHEVWEKDCIQLKYPHGGPMRMRGGSGNGMWAHLNQRSLVLFCQEKADLYCTFFFLKIDLRDEIFKAKYRRQSGN